MSGTSDARSENRWRIRPPREQDAVHLTALQARAFEGTLADADWSTSIGIDTRIAFVAETDASDIAGFIVAQVIPDDGEILSVATDPAWRRGGIASALVKETLAALAQRGVRQVFLDVARDNQGAIALYRRCGFVEVGVRKSYYVRADGRHQDAVVMRCDVRADNPT